MATRKKRVVIRVLLIDFGKTIHDYSLDRFFSWLAYRFGIPRHCFWDMFSRFSDCLIYAYECGQSTHEFFQCFQKAVAELLHTQKKNEPLVLPPLDQDEFLWHWNAILSPEPLSRELMEFFQKLARTGKSIYVLSNTNEAHLASIKGELLPDPHASRFRELFPVIARFIASCDPDIQCRKTRMDDGRRAENEMIFRKALAIAGAAPEETIFIDDIAEHVNTFRAMGGNGIHFTGNWTKVEAELAALGVLWE